MTSITIRPARPEDLPAVAELRWQWLRGPDAESPIDSALDEFVPPFVRWALAHQDTHHCLVLLRDDKPIGMAWLALTARVPFPGRIDRASGDVQSVYVVPGERNSGLGGRLIGAVLDLARDLGIDRVIVHSSERAIPAYLRHGFVVEPDLLQTHVGGGQ